MAGSYNHAVTASGNLRSWETMGNATENAGDAFETIEEMYGMIWYLAQHIATSELDDVHEVVERARQHYQDGLALSQEANRRA